MPKGNRAEITAQLSLGASYLRNIAELCVRYAVGPEGEIQTDIHAEVARDIPFLPRFGVRLLLRKDLDRCAYFGYGPNESYIDKRLSSYKGLFRDRIRTMHEDYINPQENSSHFGCDSCEVTDARGSGLGIYGRAFSFSLSRYTQEELTVKKHHYELAQSGHSVLCIDYAQSGVGSNSCGPRLAEKYQLKEKTIDFQFLIKKIQINRQSM